MRSLRFLIALVLVVTAVSAVAATRTIRIFDKRQVVIGVPENWKFDLTKDKKSGVQTIHLDDREGLKLTASFFPDPENALATEEALEERMRDLFAPVAEDTTITFAETVDGRAGHAVIGEETKGIRAWPGVFLVFTITGDRESPSYAKALEVISEGLREPAR